MRIRPASILFLPMTARVQYPGLRKRREIFASLVRLQDSRVMTISASRDFICSAHGVSDSTLLRIEKEGVDQDWLEKYVDQPEATTAADNDGA